jgi:hypothetical protein
MSDLDLAKPVNDQPIGGTGAATLFHESKWLSDWVDPSSLEIQAKYEEITQGLTNLWDKAIACFNYVLDIPYIPTVKTRLSIDGKTFVQEDAWLDPGQTIQAPALNCANRAFLLASLLRRQHSPNQVWVALGNLNIDGIGGHAWCIYRGSEDYIFETTSPHIRMPIITSKAHEGVIYFNDQEIRLVPGRGIKEPFSSCWCVPFLEDYLNEKMCYNLRR